MSTPQTFRLTSGARILRGSKRIGAFLATMAFVLGAALAVFSAYTAAEFRLSAYDQAQCLSRKTDARLVSEQYGSGPARFRYADNGCPGRDYSATEAEVRTTLAGGSPTFGAAMASEVWVGLAGTIAAAAFIFGLCWALGWVASGFTAD